MKQVVAKHPYRVLLSLALFGAGVLLLVATALAQDGSPTVSLKDSTRTVSEKVTFITLEVALSSSSGKTVTVQYATGDSGDTAIAPSDYSSNSGTLTFPPGLTSQMIVIEIIDDGTGESSEYFTVTLSNPQEASIGNGSCVVTIEDGAGSSPAFVAFEYESYTVNESDGTVTIGVKMTGSPTDDVSVDYQTLDGWATAGSDYTSATGTLTWSKSDAGKTKTFSVSITNDSDVESTEFFFVILSNPTNAVLVSPWVAAITILDNDIVCE